MGCTKNKQLVETKLNTISELSNEQFRFCVWLPHHAYQHGNAQRLFQEDWKGSRQQEWTNKQRGSMKLEPDENLRRLLGRMKMMRILPETCKSGVHRPKDNAR